MLNDRLDPVRSQIAGIVIRTLNEEKLLGRCIEALRMQRTRFELDILVVDSGSTDATLDIARSLGVGVIEVAPHDFDYSRALNIGIEQAGGELVLILSAHAIPLDDEWIAHMTAPFDDARVAGVAGRQIPWPTAPFHEVDRLARTFGATRAEFSSEHDENVLFSNAASCIRRSVWLAEPFTLPAVEDLEWAERVIAQGRTIVYEPTAVVYHSHDESPRDQARRLIDINRVAGGGAERRTRRHALREAASYLRRDSLTIARFDAPMRSKLSHLGNLAFMAAYYVVDFSRSGSTAERRREDL